MAAHWKRFLITCRRGYSAKPAVDRDAYPNTLLYKKQKTPPYMYIAHEEAANAIVNSVQPYLDLVPGSCKTAVELNPGVGLLSQRLLENKRFRKIILIESMEHFMPKISQLQSANPDRVVVKQGEFVNMSKLAYQDKMDGGSRINTLLNDLPKRSYDEDPSFVMFGAVGSYMFFKHLVNSFIFQTSLLTWGRSEMFLVLPPPIYIHLTCSNDAGYMIYRSMSVLFQILFEYQFITQVPRDYFLPTEASYNKQKGSKLGFIKSINPEYLYIVRIAPRTNFFDLCRIEDLPALWYFVKQNFVSRRNRVIPNLEKWIPGCGPRLIVNPKPHKSVQPLYPTENPKNLPQFSSRCCIMSTCDFYPQMNIFTEFGDLNASQMLTLFTQFRQWPEYGESSFLASLENSLLKMEAVTDESIDDIGQEEDDIGNEVDNVNSTRNSDTNEATKVTRTRKRKVKTVS